MAGGGGSSGGAVVQYTAPEAARVASLMGLTASQSAANAAREQTNAAITALQQQYAGQLSQLKPYTSQGITALNELNQLMGLPAYNPGTAPSAPVAKGINDITDTNVTDYIKTNIVPTVIGGHLKGYQYIGEGSYDTNFLKDVAKAGHQGFEGVPANSMANLQDWVKDARVREAARQYLGNQLTQETADQYKAQVDAYNQQMDLYNQAKSIYDANQAPLTPEQIQAKIAQTPGYQFQLSQGMDALQRAASSKGLLQSGRLLQELVNYSQGLASQTYGDRLNRLANMVSGGQAAASGAVNSQNQLGQAVAGLRANYGDTAANSILAGTNSIMQGLLAGNQQFKTIGGGGGGTDFGGIGGLFGGAASLAKVFSSKTIKNYVSTPAKQEVLEKVNDLQIDKWQYKGIPEDHIGPYAEDFKDKFGVGDGKTINVIDALGVLFSSVQALSEKIDAIGRKQ